MVSKSLRSHANISAMVHQNCKENSLSGGQPNDNNVLMKDSQSIHPQKLFHNEAAILPQFDTNIIEPSDDAPKPMR